MIVVQVTSVIGAYVFGILADRTSGKLALVISLVLMIVAILWMLVVNSLTVFFVIGGLAGFAAALAHLSGGEALLAAGPLNDYATSQ